MTSQVAIAHLVAMVAHKGQKDKGGNPYIEHPLRVYHDVTREFPGECTRQCVALLHDVVEDTEWTLYGLSLLFDEDVVDAVQAITRQDIGTRDVEPYWDYISRVCENKIARDVKFWDIMDNMDLTRVEGSAEATKTVKSLTDKRYVKAIDMIIAADQKDAEDDN